MCEVKYVEKYHDIIYRVNQKGVMLDLVFFHNHDLFSFSVSGKQSKNTTQYALNITICKQIQIT
jgi:hypothetical protein